MPVIPTLYFTVPEPSKTTERRIFLFFLFAYLCILSIRWIYTWDDSAITLAFSKSLAFYGDLVPTRLSERVEGYSTFLWMLYGFLFFKIGLTEDIVLIVAKVSSTLLMLANFFLVRKLTEVLQSPFVRLLTIYVFIFSSISFSESMNGMEGPLYLFLILICFLNYPNNNSGFKESLFFIISSCLLILVGRNQNSASGSE